MSEAIEKTRSGIPTQDHSTPRDDAGRVIGYPSTLFEPARLGAAKARDSSVGFGFGVLSAMKPFLIITGILSACLIVLQVVLGLWIRGGQRDLATSHFHTGTLMAVISLVYIAVSLGVILSKPRRQA